MENSHSEWKKMKKRISFGFKLHEHPTEKEKRQRTQSLNNDFSIREKAKTRSFSVGSWKLTFGKKEKEIKNKTTTVNRWKKAGAQVITATKGFVISKIFFSILMLI